MGNGNEPATKNEMQELRSELKNDIHELRSELKSDISRLGDELREAIHDAETRLLNAFYSFAESNQKRISMVETETAGVQSRLATVEERLLNVEKRLNMPPHQ